VAQLEDEARAQDIPLFSVLPDPPESITARSRRAVEDFARLMLGLMAEEKTMSLPDFIKKLLDETGLSGRQEKEDEETARTRQENLLEFIGAAREYQDNAADEDKGLQGFLENVSLITDLDRQEDAPQFVTLMTLHSAKGLEYQAVFIAGMEENVFPSYRALTDQDPARLEEERRLAYVGITRARRHLFLSMTRQRMIFNQVSYNSPSRFIKEIPERLIDDMQAQSRERFGQDAPLVRPHSREQRSLSFGAPGMGQKTPLDIPGVSRGFKESSARQLSAKALMSMYKKGDRVYHRKFGEGTVLDVRPLETDARISIDFIAYGQKELSLSLAPIFKLED